MSENTKQVIVIRKDLNMRKGKMCAQASHASMAFLTKDGGVVGLWKSHDICKHDPFSFFKSREFKNKDHSIEIATWLRNSFKKIVCYVNSEEELLMLHQKAIDAGLMSNLVEDNGATEFGGVKTNTCIAIGPHWDDRFIGITDSLPLL